MISIWAQPIYFSSKQQKPRSANSIKLQSHNATRKLVCLENFLLSSRCSTEFELLQVCVFLLFWGGRGKKGFTDVRLTQWHHHCVSAGQRSASCEK